MLVWFASMMFPCKSWTIMPDACLFYEGAVALLALLLRLVWLCFGPRRVGGCG